jgi:hypothetical protein
MQSLGLGRAGKVVAPLSEERATELGADMLGEALIFLALATYAYFEYQRSAGIAALKEQTHANALLALQVRIQDLEQSDVGARELKKIVLDLHGYTNPGSETSKLLTAK